MKKRKNGRVLTTIPCKVSPGMFSSERGIQFDLPDGRKVSAFVDKSRVITASEPTARRDVDGHVKVDVLQYVGDCAIVDLPQPGLAVGPRIRVPRALVEELPE